MGWKLQMHGILSSQVYQGVFISAVQISVTCPRMVRPSLGGLGLGLTGKNIHI